MLELVFGTRGTSGGTKEEVGSAVAFVSAGEVKGAGSCCSDPLVDLLGMVGGRKGGFCSLAYGEKKTV